MFIKAVSIIFFFLKVINSLTEKILSRNILLLIKSYIEQDAYRKVKLKSGKYLTFFAPNYLIDLLVRDFYKKEPETIQWIDNFKKKKNNLLGYRLKYWFIFNICCC